MTMSWNTAALTPRCAAHICYFNRLNICPCDGNLERDMVKGGRRMAKMTLGEKEQEFLAALRVGGAQCYIVLVLYTCVCIAICC